MIMIRLIETVIPTAIFVLQFFVWMPQLKKQTYCPRLSKQDPNT